MKKSIFQLICLCFLAVVSIPATAQTVLFNFGSSWKYLDNGSNQGTTWRTSTFNDASWASDTGTFGYGDPSWVTKCINACGTVSCAPSCTNKYITTYFRKTLNIPSLAIYDSVRFNIMRDDGFVLYINGTEVWRDNVGSGTISNTTLAPAAIGGADEYTPITMAFPISAFTAGNNTIALELHQNAGTSSDLTFNMQAIGKLSPVFFDYGSAWKYLDNGSDQGTGWRATTFNDASWAQDTGFFGYSDPWITKCVNACGTVSCAPSCTNKYITTYFRKVVNIANTSLYDSVRMSIKRDDGMVVFVNGTEVWRDNMGTGTVLYNTSAPSAQNGTAESTAIVRTIPISGFVNGNNTIAVEVHQNGGTSSDLTFNMRMEGILAIPAVPVNLVQGPYLQMGNQSAVSVRWRTNIASKSRVQVGTTFGSYPISVSDAALLTEHELRITGLTANTKYFYRFGTDTNFIQSDTNNFFVTAPVDNSTRRVTMAVFGDCGRNDNSFQTASLSAYQSYLTAQGMKAADMMLLVGDNAYNNGTDLEFTTNFFNRYSGNLLKNHMLFPVPGNHDYAQSAARQDDHNVPYFSLFSLPTAGECGGVASGTEAYYSYNWGNVHVLALDSYGEEDAGTTRMYDTLGAQTRWIKNDMASNTKKWTIAYFHHPPFTKGSHNSDSEGELIAIRQNFIRILERLGVDMIICGHSHDYERSYLLKNYYGTEASFNKAAHTADSSSAKYDGSTNSCPYTYNSTPTNHGTVYVVSGSSGADGSVQAGYPHDALPFSIDDGGMFFLDINDNRLDAKFIRRDNSIADKFTIFKDVKMKDTVAVFPGTSLNYTATWPGTYAWNNGDTTRSITVTAVADSTITVKDNPSSACITDAHFIDVTCTMPVFTSCPTDITTSACNNTLTYSVADTATPNPTLSYSFTGATAGSGTGSGSGSVFAIGTTTVTISATNACGTANCVFTVSVTPLPSVYSVTGTGSFCPGGSGVAVGLSNSQTGVTYQLYDGPTAIGSPVAGDGSPLTFGNMTGITTYSVVATQTTTGCTIDMAGGATISHYTLPTAYNVTGGGGYCQEGTGSEITLDNSQTGVNYQLFNGTTVEGSPVAGTGSAISFGLHTTASANYNVIATDATTGCTNAMTGTAEVIINPLPTNFTVIGGGHYCAGGIGQVIDLNHSDLGINYELYENTLPVAFVAGSNSPISFGSQTAAGIYWILATNGITGCSDTMTNTVTITIDPLPTAHAVTGGGSYCAGGTGESVGIATTEFGTDYQLYEGTNPVGSLEAGTGSPLTFGTYTTAGTYTIMATIAATGCTDTMPGTATISIDPLPIVYNVTGGGGYCAGTAGAPIGLANSQSGFLYQLIDGAAAIVGSATGTGTTIGFGNFPVAATYKVTATNTVTGCATLMADSATVSILPLPTLYRVSGGGSYCQDGTGVTVSQDTSAAGFHYQLFLGTTTIGSPMPGTGAALGFGLQTAAGTYHVVATNDATTCQATMTGSPAVTILPVPVAYTVTDGGSFCAGGVGVPVGLSGSDTGFSYQLLVGTTSIGSPVAGTSSALAFGLQTTNGNYTVLATNTLTGCSNTMASSATVTVLPLPSPIAVTGGGSYCAGGTGVRLGLGASTTGINYQLYNGGSPIGIPYAGTGLPLDFGMITTAGTYSVSATNALTSCTNDMVGSVAVAINPLVTPTASVVSDAGFTLCTGTTATFTARTAHSGTSPMYQWTVNGTDVATTSSYTYTPANGDIVGVKVISNANCRTTDTVSATESLIVNDYLMPTATITATPAESVCEGSPVTFTLALENGGSAPSYTWIKNTTVSGTGTSYTIVPNDGDNVLVTMTSNLPCRLATTVFSNSIDLSVGERFLPTVSLTAVPGTIITKKQLVRITATITNAGPTPTISWYKNSTLIAGATNAVYVSDSIGNNDSVTCVVNGSGACGYSSFNSTIFRINTLGVTGAGMDGSSFSVLPNPNDGTFAVLGKLGAAITGTITISVTNMLGQEIYTQQTAANNGNINEQIKLGSNIASGMYLLNITTANGKKMFPIVVAK